MAESGAKALNDKQARFVQDYLKDCNGTQAAIRAGLTLTTDVPSAGYYVYLLMHPLQHKIFYVGKGKGTRIRAHVKQVKAGKTVNAAKAAAISEILSLGRDPVELVFCSGCDEASAFAIERHLICALKNCGLTNISGGIITAEEAGIIHAQEMIKRLKPFDEWVETTNVTLLGYAISVCGYLKAFYDRFKSGLESCAGGSR